MLSNMSAYSWLGWKLSEAEKVRIGVCNALTDLTNYSWIKFLTKRPFFARFNVLIYVAFCVSCVLPLSISEWAFWGGRTRTLSWVWQVANPNLPTTVNILLLDVRFSNVHTDKDFIIITNLEFKIIFFGGRVSELLVFSVVKAKSCMCTDLLFFKF